MWFPAEIVLHSYLPPELEVGMLFVNRISVGVIHPYIALFELEEIPEDPDAFMAKHGVPIELAIVDEIGNLLVSHDEIGWWDDGEDSDEYRELTLDDINYLLSEFDGYINIETDEENDIILIEDKVILSLIPELTWYDEDWDITLDEGLEEE
jgi:hypothetical protein